MTERTKGPDFLVIGAMKCATSTLHSQLGAQPGIFTTDLKEPNFFGDEANFTRGLDSYESLFQSAPLNALKGESSTHYSKRDEFPRACERIHDYDPNMRIVYVMRNPISRMVSHYQHEWIEGTITCSLNQAVLDHPELILQGCYAWQLRPYLQRFGAERVLPVFFERLLLEPNAELERIARHIGSAGIVSWKQEIGAHNQSVDRRKSDPLRTLARKIPGHASLAKLLPSGLRRRIESRWKIPDQVTLSAEAAQHAKHFFDRDLERLGRWLETPLNTDNYDDAVTDRTLHWCRSAKEAA